MTIHIKNPQQLQKMKARPGFIAALDQSGGSTPKALADYGIQEDAWSGEEQMHALVHQMRSRIITSPAFNGDRILGAILFEDTMEREIQGQPTADYLWKVKNVVPFLKVDKGLAPEKDGVQLMKPIPQLEALLDKAQSKRIFGTKMRSVIKQANPAGIDAIVNQQFDFASRIIAAGLVPIVEPEVLMDGDHTLERCEEVTEAMLRWVFRELAAHRVALEQMLLKANMVVPGQDCPRQATVLEVAEATLRCMRRAVPPAVPGIVFLSGGQSDVLATQHLNAMNQIGNSPWQLSFSYGRALQAPALKAWHGNDTRSGQQALRHRARCNSAARYGRYSAQMEALQSSWPEAAAAERS